MSGISLNKSALPISAMNCPFNTPSGFCSVTDQSIVALRARKEFAVLICKEGTRMAFSSACNCPSVDLISSPERSFSSN